MALAIHLISEQRSLANHGYILDDALQFTIQFERITEGASVSGRGGRASASTPPPDSLVQPNLPVR